MPAVRVLNSRLGIDVHHARLQLLGNLGEGGGELLRSGNGQRGRIRRLLSLLAFHSIRDNRANQNSNRQRRQNRKHVRPTVGFETHPKSAFARIHFLPPKDCQLRRPIFHYTFAPSGGRSKAVKSLDAENRDRVRQERQEPWEGCCGGGASPRRDGAEPRPHTGAQIRKAPSRSRHRVIGSSRTLPLGYSSSLSDHPMAR